MISPANRISNVKEYYFSIKLKEIARMNAKGANVLNLGIGNPDRPPSDQTINALHAHSKVSTNHGYQSYTGIPELRKGFTDWYQQWYGVSLDPNTELLPLMGSKEGITHISLAFLNQDDEVLVPDPGYPTYQSVSNLVGAKIRTYDLKEENGWFPNLQALEDEGLEKVKIMWINYPNMPTGTAASRPFFEKLIAFAKRNKILIINDNPYSFILNDTPMSILEIDGAKEVCLELNSLSKSHNMAGWRIGMIAGKSEYINYILRVKSNVDSGMYKPLQLAAVEALRAPKEWYDQINAVYAQRKKMVYDILDLLECSYDKTQTGMFVWARIPDHEECVEDFADGILMKAHVFITPGFIFGNNGKRYIRISLCSSEKMLTEAFKRIKKII